MDLYGIFSGVQQESSTGIGDVEITIQTTYGPQQFTLKDCIYLKGFHTNVVSNHRLKAARFFVNLYNNTLDYNHKPYYTL